RIDERVDFPMLRDDTACIDTNVGLVRFTIITTLEEPRQNGDPVAAGNAGQGFDACSIGNGFGQAPELLLRQAPCEAVSGDRALMKGDYIRARARGLRRKLLDRCEVVCFVAAAVLELCGGDSQIIRHVCYRLGP